MRCTLAAYSPLVGRIWARARRGMGAAGKIIASGSSPGSSPSHRGASGLPVVLRHATVAPRLLPHPRYIEVIIPYKVVAGLCKTSVEAPPDWVHVDHEEALSEAEVGVEILLIRNVGYL